MVEECDGAGDVGGAAAVECESVAGGVVGLGCVVSVVGAVFGENMMPVPAPGTGVVVGVWTSCVWVSVGAGVEVVSMSGGVALVAALTRSSLMLGLWGDVVCGGPKGNVVVVLLSGVVCLSGLGVGL